MDTNLWWRWKRNMVDSQFIPRGDNDHWTVVNVAISCASQMSVKLVIIIRIRIRPDVG